eukprot:TRINITY_DN15642_c0_g1_i1.p1 TRINITY_DN15642_c0_g1~~TRINITY_DN15642_c0_g1_i1.p1  ORF type:complete len:997 (+),score=289.63 TRINITY_DN15642_c0_g1_i1:52-2991(+)
MDANEPNQEVPDGAAAEEEEEEVFVNKMHVEVVKVKNIPSQWLHPDSGEPPHYADSIFEFEFQLELEGKEGSTILQCTLPKGRVCTMTEDIEKQLESNTGQEPEAEPSEIPGPSQVTTRVSKGSIVKPSAASESFRQQQTTVGTQSDKATEQSTVQERDNSATPSKSSVPTTTVGNKSQPDEPPATCVAWCSLPNEAMSSDEAPPTPSNLHITTVNLTSEQQASLQSAVEGSGSFQYTFRRLIKPSKATPEWEDVNEARYKATSHVNLACFGEPGTTTITFTDTPLVPIPVEEDKTDDKKGKKAAPKKPAKGTQIPAFLLTEDEWDIHPYEANGAAITFKITFDTALVCLPGERPRPDILPSDIIPQRVKPTKHVPNAPKLYSAEVKEIIYAIVADYRKYSDSVPKVQTVEEGRKAFLHYLGSSGRSFAYKQKLKHCVVRIVKEKFAKKPGVTKLEMEKFYNELYVYLLDQMHFSMNATLARTELDAPPYAPEEGTDKWLRLALEAEVVQEYEMAERYHQERLVHGPVADETEEVPLAWIDYAKFCLRVRDTVKAEQAFKEAISIDISHVPSLLGYGLLLLSTDRPKEAEVFFQAAVDSALTSPLPWACLCLYFEKMALSTGETPEIANNHKKWAKYSRVQAVRALAGAAVTRAEEEPDVEAEAPPLTESLDMMLARYTLELHFEKLTAHCLESEKQARGGTTELQHLDAMIQHQTKGYEEARRILREILEKDPNNHKALTLLGDVYADMGGVEVAEVGRDGVERVCLAAVLGEEAYDKALRLDESKMEGTVLIRLGNIYCSLGRYQEACDAFMLGAKTWPCGTTWMGVGVAYYRLGNFADAEQAFNESNLLNNLNPKTWAYIALTCLKQCPGREEEADQAFHQGLQLGLADHAILMEIGVEHLRLSRLKLAQAALLKAKAARATPTVHLLLGLTYVQLRKPDEAKEEFIIARDTATEEGERAKAIEELGVLATLDATA